MKEFYYLTCCVNSDGTSIQAMVDKERDVTLATLRRHCADLSTWETQMGYGPWLRMSKDYGVSYHKSTYQGQPCYYVRHSAIEYIWVKGTNQ